VLPAIALDPDLQGLGQGVDDRHTDAVETAGHLVAALVELSARMQHGHRQLDAGNLLDRVDVDRNAAPVVDDGDRVVLVNRCRDHVGVSSERLVDRVVHHFVHEMVQTARGRRADIHARALAHGFQSLEDLDLTGVVPAVAALVFRCHWNSRGKNCEITYRRDTKEYL
jgi:hypothetical protein